MPKHIYAPPKTHHAETGQAARSEADQSQVDQTGAVAKAAHDRATEVTEVASQLVRQIDEITAAHAGNIALQNI